MRSLCQSGHRSFLNLFYFVFKTTFVSFTISLISRFAYRAKIYTHLYVSVATICRVVGVSIYTLTGFAFILHNFSFQLLTNAAAATFVCLVGLN